jgi:hypothetical protein
MSFSQLGVGFNTLLFTVDALSFTKLTCDYIDTTMGLLVYGINALPKERREKFLDFLGYPEGITAMDFEPDFIRMAGGINTLYPDDEIRLIGIVLQNLDADSIESAASDTNTLFRRIDTKYGNLLINGNHPK